MIDLTLVDKITKDNIVTKVCPTPSAGTATFSYIMGNDTICPTGFIYQLIGVTYTLITDATVIGRLTRFICGSLAQNLYYQVRDEVSVTASRTIKYSLAYPFGISGIAQGGFTSNISLAGVTNIRTNGLPPIFLTAPDSLVIDVGNAQAGDLIVNPTFRFLRSSRKGYASGW